MHAKEQCPCCGCRTLTGRAAFQMCPVCWWEDDGQDDADADVVRGGPNGALSLTDARANWLRVGASDARFADKVRPPAADELAPGVVLRAGLLPRDSWWSPRMLFLLPLFVLVGGIHWLLAWRLSGGKEPWLTALLAVGLGGTVIGLGWLCGVPWPRLPAAVGGAWALLLVRRAFGGFDRNVEQFGPVHVLAVLGTVLLSPR